jgi:hypothetical protein
MADFDGEESGCDDELVQLAAQVHWFLLSEFLSSYFFYYSRHYSHCFGTGKQPWKIWGLVPPYIYTN